MSPSCVVKIECLVDILCLSCAVDKKERKNGNDPEKELSAGGFHDYQRPLVLQILFCH